ncbi:MAG: DUF4238 domain-containing protein [Pseudomonadota bacterium]
MIRTENHHWVPKFLLRNFASDDGRVFYYNLANRQIGKRPPKQLASRPNFNDLLVSGEPTSFERVYERIETRAAPVVKQLIAAKRVSDLSRIQRFALSEFLAAQSFRTEAYRRGLAAGRQGIDLGDVLSSHLEDIESLALMISDRRWALMESPQGTYFLIGDNPLVLQDLERPSEGGALGLDMANVEVFMPLSPSLALYMPSREVGDQIVEGYWNALQLAFASIDGLPNSQSLGPAEREVVDRCLTSAGPLYRALRLGEVLPAEQDNVVNLNALQIFWAANEVFSRSSDFSFVEHVLAESPSANTIIPVRIEKAQPIRP